MKVIPKVPAGKLAESFYLARKAKQKRERSVFFVQIHYMQSVNLLLHLLSRPAPCEHSTRPCSLRSSILETKSNSFAVKNALGYPIPPHIAVRSYPSNCPNSSSDSGARSSTNRRISLKTLTFYKSSSMIPSLLTTKLKKVFFQSMQYRARCVR